MRVMIISDAGPPQVNGVVTTITNTIRELQSQGCSVDFVTPETFRTFHYPFYKEIEVPIWPTPQINKRIDDFLRYPGPHAFHIATESSLGLAANLILTKRGLNFTTAFHTDFAAYAHDHFHIPKALTWKYLRWFHNRSSRVLYATDSIKDLLSEKNVHNLSRWERGFDTEIFYPEHDKHTGLPLYLYGGRVSKEKNIEDFLKLKLPNSVVAGDGPHRKYLEGKYPHAIFVGKLTQLEMAELMRTASVFVFPSRTDTFGLVMIEAMACGTPVAAYPVQGPLDVVEVGATGWLDKNLEVAIEKAATLDRQQVALHALDRFSWKTCTEQFWTNIVYARPGPQI